jgi:hypothetical protein
VVERSWVYDGAHLWILSQDQFENPPWDVDGYECVDPIVVPDDDGGFDRLDCGATEPDGNHYQVCGEMCEACGDPDPRRTGRRARSAA